MNKSVLSVTQINQYISNIINKDINLNAIYLSGEISNFVNHIKSGHFYFTLKDEKSSIKCIMFRGQNKNLKFIPENGMKVIVFGGVAVFERDGTYQFYCQDVEPEGIGSLYLGFEQLKLKLENEGLFDLKYKKEIPKIPKKICIITSKTGAAYQDILNVLLRRYPLAKVVLIPTLVQGEIAPIYICKSIKLANTINDIDVIILGRGGGSTEDLWAFNSENVAWEIFKSKIPIVSAVGHEIDFTISDFVADLRAPTPSAAAELVTPDINILAKTIDNQINMLYNYTDNIINKNFSIFYINENKLKNLSPNLILQDYINKFQDLDNNLKKYFEKIFLFRQQKFLSLASTLEALSPLKVLNRGYSITFKNNSVLKNTKNLKVGQQIKTKLNDGEVLSEIIDIEVN